MIIELGESQSWWFLSMSYLCLSTTSWNPEAIAGSALGVVEVGEGAGHQQGGNNQKLEHLEHVNDSNELITN